MPPGLRTIVDRCITILKPVSITLRQLATKDLHYSVGEMFGVAACTSVKTTKRFVKSLTIATRPLHLKCSACEQWVNVKLGFQNIHDISQCCGAIDYTYVLSNKLLDTNNVDLFDRFHNSAMIL